uniref:Uncharacterized protein n=1 Tax=Cannabis sativa TaxID=3483 RepID=A0A803PMN8_CANSA
MSRRLNSLNLNSPRLGKLRSLWLGNLWLAKVRNLRLVRMVILRLSELNLQLGQGQPSKEGVEHVEEEAPKPWVLKYGPHAEQGAMFPLHPYCREKANFFRLAREENFRKYGLYPPTQDTKGVGNPLEDPDDTPTVKEDRNLPSLPSHHLASRDKGKAIAFEESSDDSSFEDDRLSNNPLDGQPTCGYKYSFKEHSSSSSSETSGKAAQKHSRATFSTKGEKEKDVAHNYIGNFFPSVDDQLHDLDADTLDYLIASTLKDATSVLLNLIHARARAKGSTTAFKKKHERKDVELKAKEVDLAKVQANLDLTSTSLREVQEQDEYLDLSMEVNLKYMESPLRESWLAQDRKLYESWPRIDWADQSDEEVLADHTLELPVNQPAGALAMQPLSEH